MGAHPLYSALSRRGRSPIKLAYSPSRPDGRLKLTASVFNRLGQYSCSPGHRGYCCAELAVFFLAMGVTTTSTHFTIPQRVKAESTWLAGFALRLFTCPQAVTQRSTNRARRRVTSFHPKRVTNYATRPTTLTACKKLYRPYGTMTDTLYGHHFLQ